MLPRQNWVWRVKIFVIYFKIIDFFSFNIQITIITTIMQGQGKFCIWFTKSNANPFLWCNKASINTKTFPSPNTKILSVRLSEWDDEYCQHQKLQQSHYQNSMKLHHQTLFHNHYTHTHLPLSVFFTISVAPNKPFLLLISRPSI